APRRQIWRGDDVRWRRHGRRRPVRDFLRTRAMDLRFTEDELAFRDEIRSFFREALPPSIRENIIAGRHTTKDELVTWTRILHDKGWAVPHWPVEHGGTGWSPIKQYIFLEELSQTPAPAPLAFGVNMVGPVIYTFGNEAQKSRFL